MLKNVKKLIQSIILFLLVSVPAEAGGFMPLLKEADSLRSSDFSSFTEKLNALKVHEQEFSLEEKDYFLYLTAYQHSFRGEFEQAINLYDNLANSTRDENLKLRAKLSMVNIYAVNQEWVKGLAQLRAILEVLPNIEDKKTYENALAIVAVFYNNLGQYQLGKNYSQQLMDFTDNPRSQCLAQQLNLQSRIKLEIIDEKSDIFEKAITACRSANETVMTSAIIAYQTELYLNKQPDIAQKIAEEQLAELKRANYAPMLAQYYSLLSKIYLNLKKYSMAFEYAEKTLKENKQAPSSEPNIRAYYVLYEYYREKSNLSLALDVYIKYSEADKAYLDEIKTKTLAFQIAEHQSIEQQNKIALLDEQNKVLKVQQQLDQAEAFNNRLLIAALLCAALGLGSWGWHSWQSQKRLRQLAEYDSLTGLFSRGHFSQVAQAAVSYAQVLGAPVSCILLDVDKFKRINDTLGHATGDWALQTVARVCRETCREHEVIGRIGGEEFCFVLSECSEENAAQLAESLRRALTEVDTSSSGHDFNLSASFGVSSSNSSGYDLAVLMQNADRAMYDAKHSGRNKVCIYQDGEQEEVLQS
ncbi:tetratricopeptide repeat-containing diguanylate cyclase [Shewanella cyperi]|uniref:tetratricopeptide repeat-containing diguanylate cyclase n=1 Tax=Shewanella cyperi TaxID=2814292 RepID=UPI001A94D97F|nr:GGDEF domain-containing protein [Shewanella cyperi]QSX40043.1 GGDEF domain-containing protein [Shewanella cyperi]